MLDLRKPIYVRGRLRKFVGTTPDSKLILEGSGGKFLIVDSEGFVGDIQVASNEPRLKRPRNARVFELGTTVWTLSTSQGAFIAGTVVATSKKGGGVYIALADGTHRGAMPGMTFTRFEDAIGFVERLRASLMAPPARTVIRREQRAERAAL